MGMNNLEKVIKGLLCIKGDYIPCATCKYANVNGCGRGDRCKKQCASDAIAMLKEQEAKTGTWQWKIHGKPESGGTLGEAVCDQCGKSTYATAVKGTLNYCPNCGANMMDRR